MPSNHHPMISLSFQLGPYIPSIYLNHAGQGVSNNLAMQPTRFRRQHQHQVMNHKIFKMMTMIEHAKHIVIHGCMPTLEVPQYFQICFLQTDLCVPPHHPVAYTDSQGLNSRSSDASLNRWVKTVPWPQHSWKGQIWHL